MGTEEEVVMVPACAEVYVVAWAEYLNAQANQRRRGKPAGQDPGQVSMKSLAPHGRSRYRRLS